jgi:hypothetical protein
MLARKGHGHGIETRAVVAIQQCAFFDEAEAVSLPTEEAKDPVESYHGIRRILAEGVGW